MNEILENQITEDEIEEEWQEGSVPLATSVMGDFEEDPISFFPWEDIAGPGIPMPPRGYVVQSTGSSRNYVHPSGRRIDFEAVHYHSRERCWLREVRTNIRTERQKYAWYDADGERISF
ncbi:MAG: hypothetical protein PHF67_00555 [Candidatus Nanoarchaeia archaeon]|nr:hypothetical protein [Candidatus Nanoarchaeia archaeon]